MCERKKCIYMSGHTLGICDFLSKTGHSRIAQIAKALKLKTDSEEVQTIAQGKMCPFYRERGEKEKPLQSVLAETRFKTVLKKKKKGETKKFVPKVSEAEAREIGKWYSRGLSDTQIAIQANTQYYKVAKWRQERGLRSNFRRRPFDAAEARKLYDQGLTDVEIARAIGKSDTTIYNWRVREGLEANRMKKRLVKEMQELREELYRAGESDQTIAERTGTKLGTVRAWRQYHKLPANDQRKLPKYDRDKMREYYRQGMSDSEIGMRLGCYNSTVAAWRKENGLPPNWQESQKKAKKK